jgi:hypothetical protein
MSNNIIYNYYLLNGNVSICASYNDEWEPYIAVNLNGPINNIIEAERIATCLTDAIEKCNALIADYKNRGK